jgi:hypothetical protein
VIGHVEQPRLAYGPPAFTQMEVELRRVLELGRSDQAGDAGDSGRRPEAPYEAVEPPGIDTNVVVGERHDVSDGFRDAAVAGTGQARARLAHVTDPRIAAELRADGPFRRIGTRRVVDHHDLERAVAQGGQPAQGRHHAARPVPRAHHHAHHRALRGIVGGLVRDADAADRQRIDRGQPLARAMRADRRRKLRPHLARNRGRSKGIGRQDGITDGYVPHAHKQLDAVIRPAVRALRQAETGDRLRDFQLAYVDRCFHRFSRSPELERQTGGRYGISRVL